jgi:hypothetical protein
MAEYTLNRYAIGFLIITLMIFFMLLYVYNGSCSYVYKSELFSGVGAPLMEQPVLNDPSKMVVLQGNTIPEKLNNSIEWDQTDPNAFDVSGTGSGPKSMFLFAYNKCDVSCCGSSPYSCGNGCVCITPEQKKMFN